MRPLREREGFLKYFFNTFGIRSCCLLYRHHGTEENDGEIGTGKNSFGVEENDC